MDNEQPHQELVKCVVVGDTAVGKTRLICARACNQHVSLSQLLTTHVPTVWAIDQYRIYKDVLERSWEVVDGVSVSLRLWDTFGDHEKDRRFAYGRSDVVLLCFSIASPVSLRNCKAMWFPEIRRFCPQTPVLLVGCKNDLRFMYRDERYLNYFRERSAFVRPTRKGDLVMPDEARSLADELGVHYYETSVLTYHGVNEVFENAIRAALLARRQQRFWMTNLKKVQRPLLQIPFLPPKPVLPEVCVAPSTFADAMCALWLNPVHADAVVVAGGVAFPTHRFLLAAASPLLHRLLALDVHTDEDLSLARRSSDSSMVGTFGEATVGDFDDDTECLISRTEFSFKPSRVWEQLKRRSSMQIPFSEASKRSRSYPAFEAIRIQHVQEVPGDGCQKDESPTLQTVITLSKLVTAEALQQCLQFLYTGSLDMRFCELEEIRQAAEFLDLQELLAFVSNIEAHEDYLNADLNQHYRKALRLRLRDVCLGLGLFADVAFRLEDGSCTAHRPLLMARCDVMKAMFSGDFRESNAKVIAFPGVKVSAFHNLLLYLYTDEVPAVAPAQCMDLLALANRLCLPRLVHLVEGRVVEELHRLSDGTQAHARANDALLELCLRLLEPCKLHNADQLADWCMSYLCTNYNRLCKMSPKVLRSLHPENQEYLSEHRWPPVWYLKDYDYYQKCCAERERAETQRPARRARGRSGCLFFSGGGATEAARGARGGHLASATV